MWHTLLNIYGPISIHSYGLMIAIGLLVFLYLIARNPRFHTLKLEDRFMGILLVGIVTGIVGGRLLFIATSPEAYQSPLDVIAFWQGGFRVLGAVIAIMIVLPLYLSLIKVPIIPLLDLLAIYAPVLQSISRIGCFLSGCCYGIPTTHPWGIIYTDTQSAAPLYLCLHPTQLYSAIGHMLIFAAMYFFFQHRFSKPGALISIFLILISLERFLIDFWRADRAVGPLLSVDQRIAVGLLILGIIGLVLSSFYKPQRS